MLFRSNTTGIAWWPEHPDVLAGRDHADVIGSPGTWLGLNKNGKFSALTNVRSPSEKKPDARTRGELPLMYLTGSEKPGHFVEKHSKRFDQYNGFNLLMADLSDPSQAQMHWVSNRVLMGKAIRARKTFPSQALQPGVYGLSNAMLDTPWPKVNHRIAAFAQTLAMDGGQLKNADPYLNLLADDHQAPERELPSTLRKVDETLNPIQANRPQYCL